MSVEGHQADGRRGHAGVHERAVAWLLRDDADPDPRGARLPADATSKENATVAIVNRRFAEHFFKGKSAVGKRIGCGGGPEDEAGHRDHRRRRRLALRRAARRRAAPGVRAELGQRTARRSTCARTTRSASAYSLIRNEVKQLDAAMPVYELKTLEAQLDETLLTDRLIALLSAGFGLLATLLASIGLYGVMAFVVARRRKELGIRLALGAQPGLVIWLVMREVLLLLAIGLARRHSGGACARTLRLVAAVRHPGPRSRRGDRDDRAAGGGVGGGRPDSRAPREPHRSDPRAAVRVDRCDNLVCSALERTRTSLRTACVRDFRPRTRHSP